MSAVEKEANALLYFERPRPALAYICTPFGPLNVWTTAAKIDNGSLFRGIRRWGTVSKRTLDPRSINAILKQRAEMAGLDSGEFSANGLRSGYLTETANGGIPLSEAMEQSRHRSVKLFTIMPQGEAVERPECFNRTHFTRNS